MDKIIIYFPLILSLFVYGIVLFNNGNFLDGWYVQGWIKRKDWVSLRRFTNEVGLPYLYNFYRSIYFFQPPKTGFNFLNFFSLIGTSYICAYICYQTGYFNKSGSILIACLVLTYPGNQLVSEKCLAQYFVFPLFFYCAVALNCFFFKTTPFFHEIAWCISIILFYFSFNMNSILVYYFGFFVCKGVHLYQNKLYENTICCLEYLLLLILPFIFWSIKEKLSPRSGHYKDYNKISLRLKRIVLGLKSLLSEGSLGCYLYCLKWLLQNPWIVVIAGTFSWALGPISLITTAANHKDVLIFIMSVCLILLAGIPYILVAQPFGNYGWATKNNLLLSFPNALLVYSSISIVIKNEFQEKVFSFIILACSAFLLAVNLSWIALWAKNKSILQKTKHYKRSSVIMVKDLYPTVLCNNNSPEWWNISLTYMFCYLRDKVDQFCVVETSENKRELSKNSNMRKLINATTVPYCLQDINTHGRRIKIIILKGNHSWSDIRIAIKYLFYLGLSQSKLHSFLEKIVTLKTTRIVTSKQFR